MRTYLYITASLIAVIFHTTSAEHCKSIHDCVLTRCNSNSTHIACQHDRCVCDANGVQCSDILPCVFLGRCHKHDEHYHCLDGECVCLKEDVLPGHEHGHGHEQ